MAKTNNNPAPQQDLFPDIGRDRMKLSPGLSSILKNNGIDPNRLQENIYSLYDAGGDNRMSAIQNVAGIYSKYGNDNTLSNILQSQSQPLTQEEVTAQTGSVDTWQAIKAGVWNSSVPLLVEGVAQIGNALYGGVENLVTGDTKQAAENRKNIEDYFNNWKVYIDDASTAMPVSLGEDGKVDWSNIGNVKAWSYLVSSGVGFMSPGVLTGGATAVASGITRAAGSAAQAASILNKGRLAGSAISTLQMYPGIQKEAIDNGVSFGRSSLIAGTVAPVLGAVEQMSFGSMMRGFGLTPSQAKAAIKNLTREGVESEIKALAGKGFSANIFQESVESIGKKTAKSLTDQGKVGAFASAAKRIGGISSTVGNRLTRGMVEGGGVEALEEILQGGIEYASQEIYNNWLAAEGSRVGEGMYDTNFKESAVNTIMGAVAAGIIGTSMGSFYRGQKGLDQTLYGFVKSDINTKLLNGSTSLDEILQDNQLTSVINAARDSGQINESQYNDALRRGNLLYQTAFEFKDYTDIDGKPMDDNTIMSMYNVAESRDSLAIKGRDIDNRINQLTEYDNQIQASVAEGNIVSAERLRAERIKLAETLGAFNQQSGRYASQEQLESDGVKYDTLFQNAIPAILSSDPRTKSRGNFMMKSAISAIKNDAFIPKKQVTLNDGRVMVRGENDSEGIYFRELIETPLSQRPSDIPSMSEQVNKGKYTPIPRFEYSTEPVLDYETYSEMVETFEVPNKVSNSRDINKNHSEDSDMQDLLGEISGRVSNFNQSPIKDYDSMESQVDNAYKVFQQINKSAGVESNQVIPVNEFDTMVGFERRIITPTIADDLGSITTVEGSPVQVDQEGTPQVDLSAEEDTQPTIEQLEETASVRNEDRDSESLSEAQTNDQVLESLSKTERGRLIDEIIPSNERDAALLYFAQGGKVHPDLLKDIFSRIQNRESTYSTAEFRSRLNFLSKQSPAKTVGSLGERISEFTDSVVGGEGADFDQQVLGDEGEDVILRNTGIKTIQDELITRNYPELFTNVESTSVEESVFTSAGEQVDTNEQELSDEIPNQEIENGETIDTTGDQVVTEQSSSIESSILEEQEQEESIELLGDAGIELSRQLETANQFAENTPSSTFSEEYIAEFARRLDEANRAIESEHTTAENLIGPESESATETDGNTDTSQTEPQVESNNDYVPFDASTTSKGSGTTIGNTLISKLTSAFPNIKLNIPRTVDEYLNILNNIPTVRQIFDKSNRPYGFVNPVDGSVYIDPSRVNGNTLIHEYGHIWLMSVRDTDLYGRGVSLIQNSPYMQEVRNNPAYNGLSEEQLAEEALAHAIADKGIKFLTTGKKQSIGNFISELFDKVKQFFGIRSNVPSDITLDEFLNDAVNHILSGNEVNGITSEDVVSLLASDSNAVQDSRTTNQYGNPNSVVSYPESGNSMNDEEFRENLVNTGDILLAAMKDERLEVDADNPDTGEMLGTWQERKQKVIDEITRLGILGLDEGALSKYQTQLSQIASRTGFLYKGRNLSPKEKKAIKQAKEDGTYQAPVFDKSLDRFEFTNSNEIFFLGDDSIATLGIGGAGNEPGRVTQMLNKALEKYEALNPDTALGKAGRFILKRGIEVGFNLETTSQMLGVDRIIKDVKRAGEQRLSYLRTAAGAELERLKIAMAPFSTFHDANNMDNVEKMDLNVIEWSEQKGRPVNRTITVPKAVGMQILRGIETQMSTASDNENYLVRNGQQENATAVISDEYVDANGNVLSIASKEAFFGLTTSTTAAGATSKVKKGVHLDSRFVREKDAKGELIHARDVDGNNTSEIAIMIASTEYERLNKRFNEGIGADTDKEVEAYQLAKQFFNNPTVTQMLQEENDNYLNPDSPFTVVKDYAPLRPIARVSVDARLNAFSPGIEDFRLLQDRKSKPDALWGADILADANSYLETAGYVVGSGRLVHNLKSLQYAVDNDYNGTFKKEIVRAIQRDVEQFNNYQKYLAKNLSEGIFAGAVNKYINRYTPYIFTFNLGTGMKNLGTMFSAIGQGHVDADILREAFAEVARRAPNMLRDINVEADIVEGTDRGRVGAIAGQRAMEDEQVAWLLGEHINDPVLKAEHRKRWAVVINRTLFGQNQYVQGVDMTGDIFTKGGKSAQGLSFVRNFFDRYGMGFIKRADRNAIYGFVNAARKQAERDAQNGIIAVNEIEERAAKIATNLVYETNQMNMVTDLTGLQRTSGTLAKLIGIYTGQPQKILNQMIQNFDAYIKLLNSGNAPAIKAARDRLLYSVGSNVVLNSAYMAGVTVGWRVLRAILSGDDIPEKDQLKEQFYWDTLRNVGGAFPGTIEQISSVAISLADNLPWEEGLIDIPGGDLITKTSKALMEWAKNEDPAKAEKYRDNVLNTVPNMVGVFLGMPKIIVDLTKEHLTEDADDRARNSINW